MEERESTKEMDTIRIMDTPHVILGNLVFSAAIQHRMLFFCVVLSKIEKDRWMK